MTRRELRQQGEAMRERLFGHGAAPETGDRAPGFRALMSEVVYGAIWSRPGLALSDRMICTLAALAVVPRAAQLRRHAGAALAIGLGPQAIQEVAIQIGIYAGFAASEEALEVVNAAFVEHGVAVPAAAPRDDALDALTARGRELLESLHGDRGYQGYAAPDNPVTSAFYPMAIQYGYGEIWFRPGLDRRQRALCAVAAFTALRLEAQVKRFARSALNVGVTRGEVIEAVIQTAPFSGFAPALNALGALGDVLGD
ncbi:MAG: carboxymuconolactone decarboxylase family protein [Candidatus Rokubacteria bacterium]|nr:carboxymuconolactone decarboxylase family protein [Candidatus Rokubacteria bacterium]